MAEINEPGGGGGTGGGSSICWVSPADMAGQIDNLLQRISKLETTVALLASGDVNAALLTDLANSLGMPIDFLLNMGTGDPGGTGYSGLVLSDIGISFNGGASYIPNSAGMALIYQNYLQMHMSNNGLSGGLTNDSTAVFQGGGWSSVTGNLVTMWNTVRPQPFCAAVGGYVSIQSFGWYRIECRVPYVYRPFDTDATEVITTFGINPDGIINTDKAGKIDTYFPSGATTSVSGTPYGSFSGQFAQNDLIGVHVTKVGTPQVVASQIDLYITKI